MCAEFHACSKNSRLVGTSRHLVGRGPGNDRRLARYSYIGNVLIQLCPAFQVSICVHTPCNRRSHQGPSDGVTYHRRERWTRDFNAKEGSVPSIPLIAPKSPVAALVVAVVVAADAVVASFVIRLVMQEGINLASSSSSSFLRSPRPKKSGYFGAQNPRRCPQPWAPQLRHHILVGGCLPPTIGVHVVRQ